MSLKDKYINPLTDFGFKKLFGVEPNKELLIDFLNQLLPPIHQIKHLSYTKNEHLGSTAQERKAIFDLYCESASGEKFIVEVQKAKQNFFKDRSVYYSTFPIQEQAKKGDWDFQLAAVYTIGILDFVFDEHKDRDDILHTVKLKDHKNRLFYDKLTYIYIELPKFTKSDTELQSKFDKWLYVFRHLANLQNRPIALQEKIFEKLFEVAEIAKFSPKEKERYEESLKYYRDLKNVVDASKEEGRMEGKIEGREEEKIEIASNLKKQGIPIAVIIQATGLSEDIIENL
ncbi:Rpn family recombination-promoting nuclease/putative transposase [Aureispira anguillae]|uniref:Rpn family recombination-promoting nuclease/putative transposase n=1 Tax=Aureispira anguillae TaxID=2864201 RepID=A0A915YFH7_9BACT|nr:Rpn family recombination-promoting nuclease/putative transposase [Aureispira anguillae]BDS12046.1 Rpn family recombination-promoting nuclease/putative transposase [Aureispira anguillae]